MKIELGKYYRTRDGRKVGPMIDNPADYQDPSWVFGAQGSPKGHSWRRDGRHTAFNAEHPSDLVSEWTDEPTGPVRERLVKEIVPGFYGIVCVGFRGGDKDKPEVSVAFAGHSADELRAAAATLLEIADALVKP